MIDRDYTGSIAACIYNSNDSDVTIEKSERIAQLVLEETIKVTVLACNTLTFKVEVPNSTVERGDKGFGSTGK